MFNSFLSANKQFVPTTRLSVKAYCFKLRTKRCSAASIPDGGENFGQCMGSVPTQYCTELG